jgi:hypothetical protein
MLVVIFDLNMKRILEKNKNKMKKKVLTAVIVAAMILIGKISFAQSKISDSAQDIKISYAYV